MKNLTTILMLIISVCLFSCSEEKKKTTTKAKTNTSTSTSTPPTTTSANKSAKDALIEQLTPPGEKINNTPKITNNSGVEHHICPDGHVGFGSESKGQCSKCGKELVHNQAYHNNGNAAPAVTTTTSAGSTPPSGSPFIQSPVTTTKAPEPPQNAKGVWHYTCSKGCAGGSGSAGNCTGCGGALAHNPAYH